jgi:protein-L-isoaspartate(D-aspartate) O-methyltransferase
MDRMIRGISTYGFSDKKVLKAIRKVPRHMFVPEKKQEYAYNDSPLSIGYGQTISQPFIVEEMTRLLNLSETSKVLEIGTRYGYQAAVLAEITDRVYSIEIIQPLVAFSTKNLQSAGYHAVAQRHGDGYFGWPEVAPFDGIIVTCAAGHVPPPLLQQLKPGGKMIIPVGKRFGTQHLILITKKDDNSISSKTIMPVRFVPLVRK